VDVGEAVGVLRGAPLTALLVPSLILVVNSVLHAVRLGLLLRVVPLPELLRVAFLGNFFGMALPTGGGEAAKIVLLRRHTGAATAAAALVATRIMEMLPWGAMMIYGAAFVLPHRLPAFVPFAWAAAALLCAAPAVGAAATIGGERFVRRLPAPVQARMPDLSNVRLRDALICQLLAFPFAFLNVLAVGTILWSLGADLPVWELYGVVPAVDLVVAMPVTVSGLGLREGMFVHAFAAWGVPEAVAVAAALLRWAAELGRAGIGGVLFAIGRARA
jgi:uncharacterized membrane protein YbhN (UPF0104 family)